MGYFFSNFKRRVSIFTYIPTHSPGRFTINGDGTGKAGLFHGRPLVSAAWRRLAGVIRGAPYIAGGGRGFSLFGESSRRPLSFCARAYVYAE
ncbi:hypothetical protein EVAR_97209_1 [Eumeta japonica]|uniref:Uncharacterized protein n=1 Tax=Eumeta variegata TaxID=151549 RepID=A0A4C1WJ73_EUMVA|nr:hypothetical protein EVAR_97209_1 [Eumeta japonica]